MYIRVEEQSVSEARKDFTKSLRRLASTEGGELVILVHRHGVPVGGILPAQVLAKWLSDQARASQAAFAQLVQRLSEVHAEEGPDDDEQRDETIREPGRDDGKRTVNTNLNLPEGWCSPEAYAHQFLAEGISPEGVFEGLKTNYAPYGLTKEEAAEIVVRIAKEQGIEVG